MVFSRSRFPDDHASRVAGDDLHRQAAGFELLAKSAINANPKDTTDHPFGVWTLPPNLRSTPYGSGKEEDPTFDKSKYAAIGESDRMTLKFVKK